MSSYVRNPSVGVQEHTFGFGQKMERETFSRATFVNRVQFPSTSSLAPLRLFLLVCVFFLFVCLGIFSFVRLFYSLSRTHRDETQVFTFSAP